MLRWVSIPARMGLGPTHATPVRTEARGVGFRDIGLIELNEAFAAQVIANEIAMASAKYCARSLGWKARSARSTAPS